MSAGKRARGALRAAARGAQRTASLLARLEASRTPPEVLAEEHREVLRGAMRAHDMVDDPDEAYYRERYWSWIERELEHPRVDRSGHFLDAGCGSGRLLLPLARQVAPAGGRVTGVDYLGESVAAARRHAEAEGLANVELQEDDLVAFLRGQPDRVYEAALFLEVGFVMPELGPALSELARVLRPGGLLLASFRAQLFLALHGVAARDWTLVETVMTERSANLPGMGWQNWHTAEDAVSALEAAGFGDVGLRGVGAASGIEGDPLASVARPSQLRPAELESLARVEDAYGATRPDVGRYILASARAAGTDT